MMLSKSLSRANASSTPRSSASLPGTSIVFAPQLVRTFSRYISTSISQVFNTVIRQSEAFFAWEAGSFIRCSDFGCEGVAQRVDQQHRCEGKGLCRGCFDTHVPPTLVSRSFHKEALQFFSSHVGQREERPKTREQEIP